MDTQSSTQKVKKIAPRRSEPKDEAITKFEGVYAFLALEYPCKIVYDGIQYENAATLFYAMRTDNKTSRGKIARLSPNKARIKSAALPDNDDYDNNKYDYLVSALGAKFDDNPTLKSLLIKTYPIQLINTVSYRDLWIGIRDNGSGGYNALGKALEELRKSYIAELDS